MNSTGFQTLLSDFSPQTAIHPHILYVHYSHPEKLDLFRSLLESWLPSRRSPALITRIKPLVTWRVFIKVNPIYTDFEIVVILLLYSMQIKANELWLRVSKWWVYIPSKKVKIWTSWFRIETWKLELESWNFCLHFNILYEHLLLNVL